MTKPAGMSYEVFAARMASATSGSAVGLWRRQMVLGPTPEFCLLAPEASQPPVGEIATVVTRELLWPRSGFRRRETT